MNKFVLKEIVANDMSAELEKIGFDEVYRLQASEKYCYKVLKIFDLTLPQANILKQTALSIGTDCAVHKKLLTAEVDKTDVILGGSYSQLKKIAEKLKLQPFSLKFLGEQILNSLTIKKQKTKLVGILNVTTNSFSDGGLYYKSEDAIRHMYQMLEDGADMIDIGAESTKPYANPVSAKEQIERLAPILKQLPNVPVSVDTRSSEVACFALDNGVSVINDVSGMDYDQKIADVVAKYDAGIVIQHSTQNTEDKPVYNDVAEDVYLSLYNKLEFAKSKGIKNIILDPGIGFGKTKEDNYKILDRIEEFYSLETPIMIGVSRKSLLGLQNSCDNNLKDALTLAISYPLIKQNVDYLRVHNVKLHKYLIDLLD